MGRFGVLFSCGCLEELSLLSAIDTSQILPADSKIASLHRNRCFYSTLGHLFFKRVKSYDLLKLSQWQNVDSSKLKVALVVPFIFFVVYRAYTIYTFELWMQLEVNDCPHKKWLEWQALNLYDIADEVSLLGGMGCSVTCSPCCTPFVAYIC